MSEMRNDDALGFTVRSRFGREITQWDEGFGPLWVLRETLGISGVIRAQSWEEAFECAVDEIMLDADPDHVAEYGNSETGELPDGCHFRGGMPANQTETRRTLIAQEDPNGCRLDELTEDMARDWGLEVLWNDE